jgi:undecaprenyl diphosphate synthase
MGFSRDVLRRQRDTLNSWGVRIVWEGREPRLWSSVIKELKEAEQLTRHNTRMTLYMCVNHGGRAQIVDAVRELVDDARHGRVSPRSITEKSFGRHLGDPDMPDVDLFLRTSGEQRTSNFLLWHAAYAELVFVPELWPDVDRRVLWRACLEYASRDRRYGGAVDSSAQDSSAAGS